MMEIERAMGNFHPPIVCETKILLPVLLGKPFGGRLFEQMEVVRLIACRNIDEIYREILM